MNWFVFSLTILLCVAEIYSAFQMTGYFLCSAYQAPIDNFDISNVHTDSIIECTACKPGLVLIDSFCYCPEGSYFNIDTATTLGTTAYCTASPSIPFCIAGVIKTLIPHCSHCGYGTKLDVATNTCICSGLGALVNGGCTTIPHCNYVRFINPTQ